MIAILKWLLAVTILLASQTPRTHHAPGRSHTHQTAPVAVVWHDLGIARVTGYDDRGLTATGTYAHWGELAVDPSVIPLGAWVEVAGLGVFHAEDTGGFSGNWVDIWFPTAADCYANTGYRHVRWHL